MAPVLPLVPLPPLLSPLLSTLELDPKIILNVGGKKFSIGHTLLSKLKINMQSLQIIPKNNSHIYFLDRDFYYFTKIVDIIKSYGSDPDDLLSHKSNYSNQLISEMCMYGLLDKKHCPDGKLKLIMENIIDDQSIQIISIIVGDEKFQTYYSTIRRSSFLSKLHISAENKINLSLKDLSSKNFSHVINFLRRKTLYFSNEEIINLLRELKINFEKISDKTEKTEKIISFYKQLNSSRIIQDQISSCQLSIDNKNNQYFDGNIYYPDNSFSSYSMENMNIINTKSKLNFDSEIIFDLTEKPFLGDCIEDMILLIDIPVLNSNDNASYVSEIEYKIIQSVILIDVLTQKINLQTDSNLLYLHPLIYHSNQDYKQMTLIENKITKILFEDNLIDVHRIILPLFLLIDSQNHLPIAKLSKNNQSMHLIAKTNELKNLFKDQIVNIPLLNVSLLCNFINLSKVNQNQNQTEILSNPVSYIYNRTHKIQIQIIPSDNSVYNIVIIPLDKIGLIKDFFFVIVREENISSIGNFSDDLIEMEIQNLFGTTSTKLDSSMLNLYLPIKKLGHKLPTGLYYYSFSSNPLSSQMLGGLNGKDYRLMIRIKKINGMIRFYANEYYMRII